MSTEHLYVSVPVACFRAAYAREYWETYPCPPPSTVYGMLLSVVGEEDRLVHRGVEVAVALLGRPEQSVVLRTLWRIKNRKVPLGSGANKRPDFQELLSDVRLSVWVRPGVDAGGETPLSVRVAKALDDPGTVNRFGGVCLGESTHLVDELRRWRAGDPEEGKILVGDPKGGLALPVWPDHVGSSGTRWGQYRLVEARIAQQPPDDAWTVVAPLKETPAPDAAGKKARSRRKKAK